MRDTYFCPTCHATIDGKAEFAQHKADHAKPAEAPAVAAAPIKADAPVVADKKHTAESLAALKKPELVELARDMGIDKIEGKYLSQCSPAVLEAAILEKQGE